MCRLFGVMANQEVDVGFSFFDAPKPFKSFSEIHTDGWGIGYYSNNEPIVKKEGLADAEEPTKYGFDIVKDVRSKIIISHVRKATEGDESSRNAHPFQYENWIFAHNGGVNKNRLFCFLEDIYKNAVTGETDSEVYFLLLIQEIEKQKCPVEGIQNALKIVKKTEDYKNLNFIMSDGKNLYAYRDASKRQDYYSLYALERNPSDSWPSEHKSDKIKKMLCSKSLRGERAVLICSEKLTKTNEKWEMINLRSLVIVDSNLKIDKKNLLT